MKGLGGKGVCVGRKELPAATKAPFSTPSLNNTTSLLVQIIRGWLLVAQTW